MPEDRRRVEAAAITEMKVSDGHSHMEIFISDTDGKEYAIAFARDDLMGLVEITSRCAISAFQQLGTLPHIPLVEAQAIATGPGGMSLGLTFGRHGQLYFAVKPEQAEQLARELAEAAEKAASPPH